MKTLFLLSLVIIAGVFVLPTATSAATRTIADGGGNYDSIGTWVEGAVPTSSDDVVATATSDQLTVNVASAALSVNFTGYTNTLTMDATLTVSGDVTLVSAMTIAGSSELIVDATATLTSNTKTWPNALTLKGTNATPTSTFTLADNWTVSGTLTLGQASFSPTTTINGFAINASGSLTIAGDGGGGQSVTGTTNIVLNGTGIWSSSGEALGNNLTINTAGTITISGSVGYQTGTFTYTAGTVVTTGSTVTFGKSNNVSDTTAISMSGITWNNLVLQVGCTLPSGFSLNGNLTLMGAPSSTFTLSSNITVPGTLTLGQSSYNPTTTINGFTINAGGSLTVGAVNPSGGVTGTTNIVLNGTGTWSNSSTDALKNNLTINTAGTITISGTVYYNTGTLTVAEGTLDLDGNDLSLSSGSIVVEDGGILTLQGGETVTTPTLNSGSTVTYNGSGTYSSLLIGDAYHHLTFNGTGSYTLDAALDVDGNLTITDGTLISGGNSITVAGNWSNSDTYTHGNNTVTLDGTHQTISGTTTFNNLTKTTSSSSTLTFPASTTQTISGTLTLQGYTTRPLSLRSSSGGATASINPQGARTFQYLDVQDITNTNALTALCTPDCQNRGNNPGWKFGSSGNSGGNGGSTPTTYTYTPTLALPDTPVSFPISENPTIIADLQARINDLIAQIKALQAIQMVQGQTITYLFPRYLGYGDKGEDVLKLQQLLQTLTFLPASISPNGNFGPATRNAVKLYQKAHGIRQTGNVGPLTLKALNSL